MRAAFPKVREQIRVRAIEDAQLVMSAVEHEHPRVDVARWTVPRAILDDLTQHRAEWVERMPALFERGFVSLDRYLRSA